MRENVPGLTVVLADARVDQDCRTRAEIVGGIRSSHFAWVTRLEDRARLWRPGTTRTLPRSRSSIVSANPPSITTLEAYRPLRQPARAVATVELRAVVAQDLRYAGLRSVSKWNPLERASATAAADTAHLSGC